MGIDSDALIALLPHRPPFRFVDAVDALEPGVSVRGRYRVTGDEAFLAGHFPGNCSAALCQCRRLSSKPSSNGSRR